MNKEILNAIIAEIEKDYIKKYGIHMVNYEKALLATAIFLLMTQIKNKGETSE